MFNKIVSLHLQLEIRIKIMIVIKNLISLKQE
jgi:hypothetical protein